MHRLHEICRTAQSKRIGVFIDAEESWIQITIDRIAEELMRDYNQEHPIVYNTYQLYRHDRLAFLKENTAYAQANNFILGEKIVRGAYMEKERERALENKNGSHCRGWR